MNPMRSIFAAIAALLLAACASETGAAAPAAAKPDPIGTWNIASLPAGQDGKRPFLEFRGDGQMGGNAGCNSFGGSYTLGAGDSITFGPLRQTKMYCGEPQMQAEARVVGALAKATRLEKSGAVLILRDADGKDLLELERAYPP